MALRAGGYATWRERQAAADLDAALTPSEAFREALSIDLAEVQSRRVQFHDWAIKIPEPKAARLDFDSYPFQLELYKEAAADEDAVVKKATQLGVSAYLVRWVMYWADTKGLTALYVFPTRDHVYDFSDSRMKPVIEMSDYLRSRIAPGDVQNKGLKKIGLGFVYFRGSETKRGLDSVDADVLALDEYDTLVQQNIGDAERRISGSRTGLVRRVGVPSIHDFGISRSFDESDQRRWVVKCGGCNTSQPIRFKENVAVKDDKATPASAAPYKRSLTYYIACEKCRKPLDVLKGQWVAKYPDRSLRGYHMPRLIVGHADLRKIVKASKSRKPYEVQTHHNKDLAEAYEVEGGRLTRSEIAAAQREFGMVNSASGPNLRTMGVDVASARALNIRISEHLSDGTKKALWIGTVDWFGTEANCPDDATSVVSLIERFAVQMTVIDHLPERRLALSVAGRFPGRVYLCRYGPPDSPRVVSVDEDMVALQVNRVATIDATIAAIREQRNHLPHTLPEKYPDHLVAVVRRIERDEYDKVSVRYESTDEDDFLHAEVYDLVASQAWVIRQTVDEADEDAEERFEDHYELERAGLSGYEDGDYSSGPEEGEYAFGAGPDRY